MKKGRERLLRGLYNGGNVPFGFRLSATKGRLDVHQEEAEVVRVAYRAFLREGTLSTACLWLNENSYTLRKKMEGSVWMRSGQFNVDLLHKMLTNKAYIGLKVFSTKTGKKEVKATWEAIIDEVTFNQVRERLSKNHCAKKPESESRFPFLLTEVIYCGVCGEKLSGKSAHGKTRKHPYYEHSRRTKIQRGFTEKIYNCDPHRIPAEKAENLVWQDVEQVLAGSLSQELLSKVTEKRHENQYSSEIERLKNKTYTINAQTNALTLRLAELPQEVSAAPIYKQMEKLEVEKKALEERILKLKDKELEKEIPADSFTYERLLDVLRDLQARGITTAKKQKIIVSLIERIEIFPDKLEIHYGLGKSRVNRELAIASSLFNKSVVVSSTSLTSGGTREA